MEIRALSQVLLMSLIILSCQRKSEKKLKEQLVANLKFEIPGDASFVKKNGIDNEVYEIVMAGPNKVVIQYGTTVYTLVENVPEVFSTSEQAIIKRNSKYPVDESSMVFSETPEEDRKENIYALNYYYYDTINNMICKIVKPKIVGKGMTGLFLRNIDKEKSISMYGINLDSTHNEIALGIFYSIKKIDKLNK